MKRPIIILNLSFVLGILCNEFIEMNSNFLLFVSFVSVFVLVNKSKILSIALLVFFSAYIITSISYPQLQTEESSSIATILSKKENNYSKEYIIKLKKINGRNTQTRVRLLSKMDLNVGDDITLEGFFERVYNLKNFKVFDNERYLKTKKVFYQIESDRIKIIKTNTSLKNKIKDDISRLFDDNLNPDSSALMKSMILSINSENELINSFRDLGLAHVLAISGIHINILIYFLEKLGRNIKFSRKTYAFFIVIILVIYGYIIDFPASLLRALFMYILSLLSIYTYRLNDKINDLFLSMFILLIINPFYIYSIGFYLSYSAVFSIYYIAPHLKRLLPKIPQSLNVPIALQIGLFPFIIYYFNSINLISIIANFMIIPIISISLITGFLYVIFRIKFLALLIDGSFQIISRTIEGVVYISGNLEISFKSFDIREIIIFYITLIIIFNYKIIIYKLKNKSMYILIVIVLLLSKLIIPQTIVNFIDVGQGDAAIIRSSGKVVMVDVAGNYLNMESSANRLVDYLNKNGIYGIDALFISHDDVDHSGNLQYLLDKLQIGEIYSNNLEDSNSKKMKNGDMLKISDLDIKVILDGENSNNSNDSSLVLLINAHNKTILFTGDVEENEKFIKVNRRIDFLKVSHHGSKFSTSEDFLERNSISNAIISVGRKNSYGHPHQETLDRLEEKNIKIYRTDMMGNIQISINPFGYSIRPYNEKIDIFEFIKSIILF